ncbi:MAG: hypothetical protein KGI54_10510 [Pseudomonadota bacterium]|nr:hypothetical protein [Pseudomonadota bacterium]
MSWLIAHIWAFLTRQQVVYLEDVDGEITRTFAKASPFGDIRAKRYWPSNTRNVTLLPDGKVKGASYVKRWTK